MLHPPAAPLFQSFKDALRENEELKTQIVQLTEDNNRLQAEQFELDRLRKLYELDQNYMQYDKIGARVIARDSEKWFQVFRINKGSADGVAVDMNVRSRRKKETGCFLSQTEAILCGYRDTG